VQPNCKSIFYICTYDENRTEILLLQDKCISAQYMNDPPAPNYDANHCVLSDAEGPGAPGCEHWFAYTISPPATAEDKPFPYTLCQTVCPVSDGMVFESDSGENFRISCGKRHGTAILWTESTPTFDACMNSCGKVLVSLLKYPKSRILG
jgi:hypothetical protein